MTDPQRVSIVVPVYNSEPTLRPLAEGIDSLGTLVDEVIFVDDGSADGSWAVVTELLATRPGWKGIRLGRNAGQHSALLAGVRAASSSIVVTMDDDLQHPPEEIPKLLAALTPDLDLVYGVAVQEEHGATRSWMSRVVKQLMRRSLGVASADDISAFRCFRTHVREAFESVNDPYVSLDVLLSWGTTRTGRADVRMEQRAAGRSNYTIRSLTRHAFNMITGYSAAPLRVVAYLGLLLSMLGFGALVYVLLRFALGQSSVAGFTFLASLLSLVAGTQMLAIAIIGEYLARVHFRAMRKPAYFVREVIGRGAP